MGTLKQQKWHISEDGKPGICKATIKACPLGGPNEHYDTLAEAIRQADIINSSGFMEDDVETHIVSDLYFPAQKKHDMSTTTPHDTDTEELANFTSEVPGTDWEHQTNKRAGSLAEAFVTLSYARSMGCDVGSILTKNGEVRHGMQLVNVKQNPGEFNPILEQRAAKKVREQVNSELEKLGYEQSDNNLIKSVFRNQENGDAVVQMGAPNMPDLAYIKDGKITFIEAKDLSTTSGSQIDSRSGKVNDKALPDIDTSDMPEKVKEGFKLAGFNKTVGTNHIFNNLSYTDSLEYFVNNQKRRGISKLSFINRKGFLEEVDLSGNSSDIANKLDSMHVHSTVQMRSNMLKPVTPSQETINHWKTKRAVNYFTSGKYPSSNNLTLRDFHTDNDSLLSVQNGKLCIGEMQLPVRLSSLDKLHTLDANTPVDMSKVKAKQMTLIGHLWQSK